MSPPPGHMACSAHWSTGTLDSQHSEPGGESPRVSPNPLFYVSGAQICCPPEGSLSLTNPSSSQARHAGHHLPLPPFSGKELVGFSLCQSPWLACADSRQGLLLTDSQPMHSEIGHTQHQQLHLPFPPMVLPATHPSHSPSLPRLSQVSNTSICIRNTK